MILSEPPDGESESNDDTEPNSAATSSGHQSQSQSQNRTLIKNSFKGSRKRATSADKRASVQINPPQCMKHQLGGNSLSAQSAANNSSNDIISQLRNELFNTRQDWYKLQSTKVCRNTPSFFSNILGVAS